MAVNCKSAELIALEAFKKLNTGFDSPKEKQLASIIGIIQHEDVFICLPTGFGKTYITAALPHAFDIAADAESGHSVVLCVSPLVALKEDQKQRIESMGVSVTILNSNSIHLQKVETGEFQIIISSPEMTIENPDVRAVLQSDQLQSRVMALVVDEAHCISKWGTDFRPSYGRLGEVRSLLSTRTHFVAMTGTAENKTKQDIMQKLRMNSPITIELSPDRPNIFYGVLKSGSVSTMLATLANNLRHLKERYPKTIIFCRKCDECGLIYITLMDLLKEHFTCPPGLVKNIPGKRLAEVFMSENTLDLKKAVLENFIKSDTATRVVICTEAFGMGLDCSEIQQIIHMGPASTAESYIQQAGRSGRDGAQARALMLPGNVKYTDKNMRQYYKTQGCRRKYLFGACLKVKEEYIENVLPLCKCCNNCSKMCTCGSCVDLNSIM